MVGNSHKVITIIAEFPNKSVLTFEDSEGFLNDILISITLILVMHSSSVPCMGYRANKLLDFKNITLIIIIHNSNKVTDNVGMVPTLNLDINTFQTNIYSIKNDFPTLRVFAS